MSTSASHSLRRLLAADLRRKALWCYGTDGRLHLVKTLLTDGTASMILYRLMQWSNHHRLLPLTLLFNKLNAVLCHCIIGRGAEFGPGFVLVHSQGVVINRDVRAGSNIVIEHQVTIGAERGRSPILEDAVFIGAGAKIIGNIIVGRGAKIGANAVVVKNVPPFCTAVGIPARFLPRPNGELDALQDGMQVVAGS